MYLLSFAGMMLFLPGCASSLRSNSEWTGFLGRSLSVVCEYDGYWKNHTKYWCKGSSWSSCETVVATDGSEAEKKKGRTSIKDNKSLSEFTVRLDNLTLQDAGSYWCAIQRPGYDPDFHVNIIVLPERLSQLEAPKFVHATLGTSVSVKCSYTVEYTGNTKYWCRGSGNSCRNKIEISEVNVPMRLHGVSFEDNHSLLQFTMTIDDMSQSDTGMYSCGVTVPGKKDLIAPINITVTTTETNDPVIDLNTASKWYLIFTSSQIHVPFLISIILKIPIFLWIIFAIIWMHRRCRQHSEKGKAPRTPEIPH